MDPQQQENWTLGIVISVVVGGGVVLAALLAVILAPLAPWLGSRPPIGSCTAQQLTHISAASPAGLSGALDGATATPVSAASLSLQASCVTCRVHECAGSA